MFTNSQLEDLVDLWEIWIEYDQFHPTHFGTLYVLGEMMTDARDDKLLIVKKNNTGHQLVLQLPKESKGKSRMKEVFYSEPVKNIDQYNSVCIYSGDKIIASFNEIEVLI